MHDKSIIILGPPGSGKSTQARFLSEEFDLAHVDIGKELRLVASQDTELGERVNHIIHEKKELVPDSVIAAVLDNSLQKIDRGILLDGAPRCNSQIDEVLGKLALYGRPLYKVVYLALPLEESIRRISSRYLCLICGQAYLKGRDKEVEAGKCSHCGGEIGQRKDDTEEGVRKRYQVFMEETQPVIEFFRKQGTLLEVDSTLGIARIQEFIKANV
jgi:adenylate kinase